MTFVRMELEKDNPRRKFLKKTATAAAAGLGYTEMKALNHHYCAIKNSDILQK